MIFNKREQQDFLIDIIKKAAESPTFKKQLIQDSQRAIKNEFGQTLDVREGYNIDFEKQDHRSNRIFEEKGQDLIIYLPESKFEDSDELLEEELEMVVGGGAQSSLENMMNSSSYKRKNIGSRIKEWWG